MSKYDPDYYNKNKDKMKASNRIWYEKNKAAILTKMREKRLNRTDEQIQQTREKRREYYEKNKDAFLSYSRNKYQEQKAKMAELEEKVKQMEANNARED